MNLRVMTPYSVALNILVFQVTVDTVDGFFTLKPKHVDFIDALRPGIISYKKDDKEAFIACNRGVIVKKGEDVSISTPLAILGENLDELKKKIAIDFQNMEEERKEVRVSMARLEVGLTKGLTSLNLPGGSDGGI